MFQVRHETIDHEWDTLAFRVPSDLEQAALELIYSVKPINAYEVY
jgi:hypothetical protein